MRFIKDHIIIKMHHADGQIVIRNNNGIIDKYKRNVILYKIQHLSVDIYVEVFQKLMQIQYFHLPLSCTREKKYKNSKRKTN